MLTPSKYFILVLSTFTCIYATIDMAFDVISTPSLGGCDEDQQNKLKVAFEEVMEMTRLISDATIEMAEDRESPRVGHLLHAMFAFVPTERLADPDSEDESEGLDEEGAERTNAEVETLLSIDDLMQAILLHGKGSWPLADKNNLVGKTRIYCSTRWLIVTENQMDPSTGLELVPQNPIGREYYWERQTNTYMEPPDTLKKGNVDTICGLPRKGAVTYREFNSITFCPFYWNTFNELVQPRPATIQEMGQVLPETIPPRFLDDFQSISKCFLHEYTHLVGRGPVDDYNMPDVNLEPEQYGFFVANTLAEIAPDDTLRNADSYAVLGTGLLLNQCDWRNGGNKSPASYIETY